LALNKYLINIQKFTHKSSVVGKNRMRVSTIFLLLFSEMSVQVLSEFLDFVRVEFLSRGSELEVVQVIMPKLVERVGISEVSLGFKRRLIVL